jgi:hypothetical protein
MISEFIRDVVPLNHPADIAIDAAYDVIKMYIERGFAPVHGATVVGHLGGALLWAA